MKKFLIFGFIMHLLGFIPSIYANESPQPETIVKLNVDVNRQLQVDATCRDKATVIKHDGEYYVYTSNKVRVCPPDKTKFAKQFVQIEEPGRGGLFYMTKRPSEALKATRLYFNAEYIIGYDSGAFPRVKFSVAGQNFYMCRPEYHCANLAEVLIDTTGFHKHNAFVEKDSLLVISKEDTLQRIKIIEPKYAVFLSCSLNDNKTLLEPQNIAIREFNDPERTDTYEIDFASVWGQLATGNTLQIKMAVLGDSGAFDKEYIKTYKIQVNEPEFNVSDRLLLILIISAMVIIVAGAIAKDKIKRSIRCFLRMLLPMSNPSIDDGKTNNEKEEQKENTGETECVIPETKDSAETPEPVVPDSSHTMNKVENNLIVTLSDEIKIKNKEISRLNEVLEQDKSAIAELEGKVKNQNEIIREYEMKISTHEADIRKQEETITKANEKIRRLNNKISSLDKEYDERIKDLNTSHDSDRKKQQNDIARLQEKINHDKSTIAELEEKVENQNEIIREYEMKISTHEADIRKQEETITNANENIRRLNNTISSLKEEYDERIKDLNASHDSDRKKQQDDVARLQEKINEVSKSWADDKKGIINFYSRYFENMDKATNEVLEDADPDSSAYIEISQMADSMNGYLAFKNKALEILGQTTRPINEIETQLGELLISDIKYEKSWFNTVARLHAYAQVKDIDTIFGYYDSYSEGIKNLYNTTMCLSELLGITDVKIPVLLKDEFSSKNYEYKNTNLVLPQLYPNYVDLLKPMAIYDISRVGYTYLDEMVKPIVAYYIKK